MNVPVEQQIVIKDILILLDSFINFMSILESDCEGDLNKFKTEYKETTHRLRDEYNDLWVKIRSFANGQM